MANLRWSFADSHMHLSEAGWGRQTTARELPRHILTRGRLFHVSSRACL
jgi:hypothetical protein